MLPGRILAGGLLLVLGRKLFWLFIALLGFTMGQTLAIRLFNIQQEWLQLVIGIAFGVAGALIAIFLEEIAIAVAGFLSGAYIATSLAASLGQNAQTFGWLVYIVGGIIGAILMFTLFDWALIILSSLAGALLISEGIHQTGPIGWLIIGGLFIVGVVIQANMERPVRRKHRASG